MSVPRKIYFKIKNFSWPYVSDVVDRARSNANMFADEYVKTNLRSSLILNGFWRSGTTKLQDVFAEALSAKTYFEPFEPGLPGTYRYIYEFAGNNGYDASDRALVAVLMPFIDSQRPDDSLWDYLDSIILGNFSNRGLVRNRKSFTEGFRRNKCIKCVRGHFILYDLIARYDLPVLHVRRHPYSVVASLMKIPNWNQGGFNDLDLHHLLRKHRKNIRECDESLLAKFKQLDPHLSKIERVTAYWCCSELVAEYQLKKKPYRSRIIQFERFMSLRNCAVDDILSELRLPQQRSLTDEEFSIMSMTSYVDYKSNDKYDSGSAYKEILSAEDTVKIDRMLSHFEIEKNKIDEDVAHRLYCRRLKSDPET